MQKAHPKFDRIAFVSSPTDEAKAAYAHLTRMYGGVAPENADIIVALGGDGLMLRTLHRFLNSGKPIYGMNRGSVGFLMNEFREDDLPERLEKAVCTAIHPLLMEVRDLAGVTHSAHAINEVSLMRQTYQASKLRITIDGRVRLEELVCDGILIATPAGSTAYNLSAHGPILPMDSPLLALTPISAFRPRRWRGALLSNRADVRIDVLDAGDRLVSAAADHNEIRSVAEVRIRQDNASHSLILFDPDHSWEERILTEQFRY